jgi:hypothetical protein
LVDCLISGTLGGLFLILVFVDENQIALYNVVAVRGPPLACSNIPDKALIGVNVDKAQVAREGHKRALPICHPVALSAAAPVSRA